MNFKRLKATVLLAENQLNEARALLEQAVQEFRKKVKEEQVRRASATLSSTSTSRKKNIIVNNNNDDLSSNEQVKLILVLTNVYDQLGILIISLSLSL